MRTKTVINRIATATIIASAAGVANADLIDGRQQISGWDFGSGYALDITGNNNGQIIGGAEIGTFGGREAAGFLRGRSGDYIRFEDRAAYQLSDGVVAINFKQTGHWNSMETLFSKDASGYLDGGHLTINLIKGSSNHEGYVQVRLQSDSKSYYVNSGTLNLNQWYGLEFGFGAEGMKLEIDGVVVDTNVYTGGLLGNTEEFSLGSSRWGSQSGQWNNMRNGYSGYISSVGIYGNAVPGPGVATLFLAGGLLCARRRR